MTTKQNKGFTLLEILLVIAAIGILAAIVLVAINPNRQLSQARNTVRQADINTIQKAVEQYLIEKGSYPSSITTTPGYICNTGTEQGGGSTNCSGRVDLRELVPDYIAGIPKDPQATGTNTGYIVAINPDNNKVSIQASLSERGILVINPLSIVQNGLVLNLDAGNPASYPGSGTTWFDLSGNSNNFTLNSASAFNSSGPKYMDFNGSFGASFISTNITLSNTVTYMVWTRVKSSTAEWRTLTRAQGGSNNHHVIFEAGSNRLGMYNNSGQNSPIQFVNSGFSQTSLPNYGTSNWVCLYWRFNTSAPYYQFSYNDTPGTIRGSSNQTGSQYWTTAFGSLGAHNAVTGSPSQFWGDISAFYVYNRVLSDNELLQNFNATRGRFGL
jgi:prepilin-type N-terminal cleavage/methylation domain-containing protein